MAVLITGAGLVGAFAAKELLGRGEDAVLYELAPNHEAIAAVLGDLDVPLVKGDVRDVGLLVRTMQEYGVDSVIHTAGLLTAGAQAAPLQAVNVNVGGTAALIDACQTANVRRFVFCSSVLVYYGMLARALDPIPGDFAISAVSERPPLVYAATKLACEHIGANFCELAGIEFVALRFGALFGPWLGPIGGVTGIVFRSIVEQAVEGRVEISDPKLIWQGKEDFTYVRDAAAAVVAAALWKGEVSGAHNIAMGRLYSFDDVLDILKSLNPDLEISCNAADQGGIAGFKFERKASNDVSSAEDFGWKPEFQMRESLSDYIKWTEAA